MTIGGNPNDYIIIFGGSSMEKLTGKDLNAGITKLKTTLRDDFWTYNVRNKVWQPIFPNSEENPGPTESGTMITLKPDRIIAMFGG